jgi:hypothetical protein
MIIKQKINIIKCDVLKLGLKEWVPIGSILDIDGAKFLAVNSKEIIPINNKAIIGYKKIKFLYVPFSPKIKSSLYIWFHKNKLSNSYLNKQYEYNSLKALGFFYKGYKYILNFSYYIYVLLFFSKEYNLVALEYGLYFISPVIIIPLLIGMIITMKANFNYGFKVVDVFKNNSTYLGVPLIVYFQLFMLKVKKFFKYMVPILSIIMVLCIGLEEAANFVDLGSFKSNLNLLQDGNIPNHIGHHNLVCIFKNIIIYFWNDLYPASLIEYYDI